MLGRNLIVILAMDWRKIKKKKRKKKEEEWWQLICDNGIAEMEGKKKKRIVAMELPKIKGERKYLIGILVCQKKKFCGTENWRSQSPHLFFLILILQNTWNIFFIHSQ